MSERDSLPSNQCGECAKLHAQIERLDDDLSEVMDERDRATEALAQTHIALGGDGEWTGKLPPEPTPHSGDLHDDVPALAEELRADNERLTDVLRRNGFRECDIPVCNCGSWHHVGGFAERFREIDEATADDERNGETLLTRIGRIVADRERLRAALTDIAEPKGMDNESENALRRHIARRALEGAASVAPAERKP